MRVRVNPMYQAVLGYSIRTCAIQRKPSLWTTDRNNMSSTCPYERPITVFLEPSLWNRKNMVINMYIIIPYFFLLLAFASERYFSLSSLPVMPCNNEMRTVIVRFTVGEA